MEENNGYFIIDNAKDEETLEKRRGLLKSLRNKKSELRNSCKGFKFVNTSNKIGRLEMQLEEVFEEDKWNADTAKRRMGKNYRKTLGINGTKLKS